MRAYMRAYMRVKTQNKTTAVNTKKSPIPKKSRQTRNFAAAYELGKVDNTKA